MIKADISDISHSMGNCHDIRCKYIHFSYLFILFLNGFVKCIHHECSTMNEPKAAHDSQIRVAEAGERASFCQMPGNAFAIKHRNCEHFRRDLFSEVMMRSPFVTTTWPSRGWKINMSVCFICSALA